MREIPIEPGCGQYDTTNKVTKMEHLRRIGEANKVYDTNWEKSVHCVWLRVALQDGYTIVSRITSDILQCTFSIKQRIDGDWNTPETI